MKEMSILLRLDIFSLSYNFQILDYTQTNFRNAARNKHLYAYFSSLLIAQKDFDTISIDESISLYILNTLSFNICIRNRRTKAND